MSPQASTPPVHVTLHANSSGQLIVLVSHASGPAQVISHAMSAGQSTEPSLHSLEPHSITHTVLLFEQLSHCSGHAFALGGSSSTPHIPTPVSPDDPVPTDVPVPVA